MKYGVLALICCLGWFANISSAFHSNVGSGYRFSRFASSMRMMSTAAAPSANPFDQIIQSFQGLVAPKKTEASKPTKVFVDLTKYDAEIAEAKAILVNAATTKKEDGDKVIEALLSLEQLMRAKNKLDEGNRKFLR